MLGPRFIPESVFYTQSVMLCPRLIPESVFYTQLVVRSPCFILTDFRLCAKLDLYWEQGIDYRCPSGIPNEAGRAEREKRLVCSLVQMISRIDSCI